MIAVIFEVQVAEGRQGKYLDIAAELKPKLKHRAFNLIHSLLRKSSSSILVV